MSSAVKKEPNPKRVAAGRRNRALRGPLSEEARERLRQAALKNCPSQFSTGPRTPAGKAKSSQNGRWNQTGESVREARRAVAGLGDFIEQMQDLRALIARPG